MKRNEVVIGFYIGAGGGILMLLSNLFLGGSPSRFGWIKSSNILNSALFWLMFSLFFLSLGLYFDLKTRKTNKEKQNDHNNKSE